MQGEFLLSEDVFQDGEAANTPGCLSVLLWPPFSVVLFGALLFFGLSQIRLGTPVAQITATPSPATLAPFFSPSVMRWEQDILDWAREHRLDPNLVATVMQIESCGDPSATSPAGAMGLFQVMPYHFTAGENSYDPQTNASRGLDYLQNSLTAFEGDPSLALAGYNGGINGASRAAELWAQETRDYRYWGENIYADAAAGRTQSPVLAEWLAAGGASLCVQAEQHVAAAR